jgi:hypothetical protein
MAAIIAAAGKQSSNVIYIEFSDEVNLMPPAEADDESWKLLSGGDSDVKLLDAAPAFVAQRNAARRVAFARAMLLSFQEVLGGLVTFEALPPDAARAGKPVMRVHCATRRGSEYYLQRSRPAFASGDGKLAGVLYELVVNWKLELFDEAGKPLYTRQAESRPAESFQFNMQEGAPQWAPYSVMMDSAYYNYVRELLEASGLPTPFERSTFQFDAL